MEKSFDISLITRSSQDIGFSPNGYKMFVVDASNDQILAFDLSTPNDVSTASLIERFSVRDQDRFPISVAFNTNGTRMFVLGRDANTIYTYNLVTGYDLTTAQYAGEAANFSIGAQEDEPRKLVFHANGRKMFVLGGDVGGSESVIHSYTLTSAYDVSSASYDGAGTELQFTTAIAGTFFSFQFDSDGSKLFALTGLRDRLLTYNLNVAYDLTTATYAGEGEELSLRSDDITNTDFLAVAFNPTGTKLWMLDATANQIVEFDVPLLESYQENNPRTIIDIDANDGMGGANDTSVSFRLKGPDASSFSMTTNGLITVNEEPDFEMPGDENVDNLFEITVVASNSIEESEQRLLVQVEDENDIPVFTNEGLALDLSRGVLCRGSPGF